MDAGFSYRQTAVRGATPVQLVICLYEQAIEDLRRAVIAMQKGMIETRTREVNHALMILSQLQRSLDLERGGEVARNLARFYSLLRAGLIEAHVKQSATILEQQISQLATVREAWLEVERVTPPPQSTEPTQAGRGAVSPGNHSSGWDA